MLSLKNLDVIDVASTFASNKKIVGCIFLFFCSISIFLFRFNYYAYSFLALYVSLGTLFYYFLLSNHFNILTFGFSNSSGMLHKVEKRIFSILVIIFNIAYSLSLSDLLFISPIYSKSLSYYIFISICFICVLLLATLAKNSKYVYFCLLLSILLEINIFVSNYVVYPNGVYANADTHYQMYSIIFPILQDGFLPFEFYSYFPLHHILVVCMSLFASLHFTFIYTHMVGIIYVFISLFVYLLGNFLLNKNYGVVCVAIFSITPEVIYHATYAYQFSYAIPFAVVFLYLFLMSSPFLLPNPEYSNVYNKYSNIVFVCVKLLFILSLVFVHQFTSTVTIAVVVFFLFTFSFYSNKTCVFKNYLYFITLYICILFGHWIFFSFSFPSLIRIVDLYWTSLFVPENYYNATYSNLAVSDSPISPAIPLVVEFLNISGKGILFLFSVVGSFYGISKKKFSFFSMTLVSSLIFGIISLGSFVDMPLLLSGRLLTFFWITGTIYLAGLGIYLVVFKTKLKWKSVFILILFIGSILSLGSYATSEDANLFASYYSSIDLYDTNEDIFRYQWIEKNTITNDSYIFANKIWAYSFSDSGHRYKNLNNNFFSLIVTCSEYEIEIGDLDGSYIVLSESDINNIYVYSEDANTMNSISYSSNLIYLSNDYHIFQVNIC